MTGGVPNVSRALALAAAPPTWSKRAKCQWIDPELFFAPDNERGGAKARREAAAKAVCAICVVRAECLTFAVDTRQHEGVWGGLAEGERAALRRGLTRKPVTTEPDGEDL